MRLFWMHWTRNLHANITINVRNLQWKWYLVQWTLYSSLKRVNEGQRTCQNAAVSRRTIELNRVQSSREDRRTQSPVSHRQGKELVFGINPTKFHKICDYIYRFWFSGEASTYYLVYFFRLSSLLLKSNIAIIRQSNSQPCLSIPLCLCISQTHVSR